MLLVNLSHCNKNPRISLRSSLLAILSDLLLSIRHNLGRFRWLLRRDRAWLLPEEGTEVDFAVFKELLGVLIELLFAYLLFHFEDLLV